MEYRYSAVYVGARVGVVLEETSKVVRFLGYGRYVGVGIPDQPSQYGEPPKIGGPPSEKIVMDSGEVVWGWEASGVLSECDMRLALERCGKKIRNISPRGLRTLRAVRAKRWQNK